MKHRLLWLVAVMVMLSLVAAQCNGAAPTEAPKEEAKATEAPKEEAKATEAPKEEAKPTEAPATEAPKEEATEAPKEEASSGKMKFGQVTDVGGIDDKGFNQLAWEGMQKAAKELGVEVKVLESSQQTDYEKNINEFVNNKYDGIVTVGFLLADATKAASEANPNTPFAIVDFPSQTKGDMGMLFSVDQPAFLAGYLAAGMSETGTVCTFGGVKIPPVTSFMIGFEQGVMYYNEQNSGSVKVLGWKTDPKADGGGEGSFTGNFESAEDGRSFAENFFDEGCDIILPVAGPVGLGSAAAAQDRGLKVIGVDADWYNTATEYKEVFLTSVLKKIDVAVYAAIQSMVDGKFKGGTNMVGTLENGEVGLAPYHDFEGKVPQKLQDELAEIEKGIIAGDIVTNGAAMADMPEDDAAATEAVTTTATITDTEEMTATEEMSATEEMTSTEVITGKGGTYGQVTDVGGIDDKGFNQLAWKGMQEASKQLGVKVKVLESSQQTDYEKNINEFVSNKYDGIVTVGFLLADATKAASEANPDLPIAIVDYPSQTKGDMGLLFAVDQPSFLAGYLAAAMSETGTVCTFGGVKIPPVVAFMVGFENGVKYYNAENSGNVKVLGWKTDPKAEGGGDGSFTGNFESLDDGRSFAENFFDEGCDIIYPIAGPVGLGSAAAAQDRDLMVIGVDADLTQTAPEYKDVYLTSVLKKIDVAVIEAVKLMDTGKFVGGTNYLSTLENGGVGLAPFYDYDKDVGEELKAELAEIQAGIIDGSISTGWPIEK